MTTFSPSDAGIPSDAEASRFDGTTRFLGRHDSGRPGPTVLLIAAVHGNEPAGLAAARQVLLGLDQIAGQAAGRVVALIGNQPALAAGRRFIDRDLNRMWTTEQVAIVDRASPEDDDAEQGEQRAMLALFREMGALAAREGQPLVFVDLHSTSGPSSPFTVINDTLASRRLALASPVPLILGLEEVVHGTLLDYVELRGHPCVLVEGGQHEDPQTARSLETMIWHILGALGTVPAERAALARAAFEAAADGPRPPRVVELIYAHEIESAGDFRMRPGYRTFAPVAEGDLLADDHGVEVRAPMTGLLLLPLYQAWGNDGFFIGRAVNRAWLTVSTAVRAVGLGAVLSYLPGVTRDPHRPGVISVNRRVARWFVVELFHLAGYRRLSSSNDTTLSFRRRNDR